MIGGKIRTLRKNKNITQAQLAEALAVTAQSVSKWENGLTVPDISIIPVIARYFGITIDDLFGYRLDALSYKERFIRFMMDNGMLRFGRFTLLSGRVSPYLIHSGYYHEGTQIAKLGEFYAQCMREHAIDDSLLVGHTKREIPLVIATSMTLYQQYGKEGSYCIEYALLRDEEKKRDMTLITDVFTSGNSIRHMLDTIYTETGQYPSHIVVCVDRMECSENSGFSACHDIEKHYGVKIHSIVTVEDIIRAIENHVIGGEEYLDEMKAYWKRYKGE